ncbi:DNA-binding transcriptional LysR family regulator [Yoonia maritima]|uniref:DNA-binding transcriptional LysR family regulator n=1 Tax=Yoonia maritima TaxID=1435347 RepID=A0A2T0VZ95_9RHOB|nr:LysR family transcriptional regulator [Yoonia maritima]PRY77694.1 DNA-binding transcriptional LysR family regulator [Yoonia maritima]
MAKSVSETGQTARLIQRGLRFSQLRLIVCVEDTGQISTAADQLGMTQPAASRLLSELEKTSGCKLYERHPRGVDLTEAGHVLAARARKTLQELDSAFDEISLINSGARGIVRIGTVTGPGLELILPVVRELRVTYPDIEFDVLVDTSDKLSEALLAHNLDFYLGRVLGNTDPRAVTLRPVGPEPIALVVRNGHPLLRNTNLTLKDCLAYDWVMQATNGLMRSATETYLLEHDLEPPARVLSTSSLLLTMGLISDTNAITPIARSVAELFTNPAQLGSNVRILDVAHDMSVGAYALIQRRGSDPSPAVRRVLNQLKARLDQIS